MSVHAFAFLLPLKNYKNFLLYASFSLFLFVTSGRKLCVLFFICRFFHRSIATRYVCLCRWIYVIIKASIHNSDGVLSRTIYHKIDDKIKSDSFINYDYNLQIWRKNECRLIDWSLPTSILRLFFSYSFSRTLWAGEREGEREKNCTNCVREWDLSGLASWLHFLYFTLTFSLIFTWVVLMSNCVVFIIKILKEYENIRNTHIWIQQMS